MLNLILKAEYYDDKTGTSSLYKTIQWPVVPECGSWFFIKELGENFIPVGEAWHKISPDGTPLVMVEILLTHVCEHDDLAKSSEWTDRPPEDWLFV